MKNLISVNRVKRLNGKDNYIFYGLKISLTEYENLSNIINLIKEEKDYEVKKERIQLFQDVYNIPYSNIVMYGEITKADEKNIIDTVAIEYTRTEDKKDIPYYTCFGGNAVEAANKYGLLIHQDKGSCMACLKSYLNDAEYILIFKVKQNDSIQTRFTRSSIRMDN